MAILEVLARLEVQCVYRQVRGSGLQGLDQCGSWWILAQNMIPLISLVNSRNLKKNETIKSPCQKWECLQNMKPLIPLVDNGDDYKI